MISPRNTRIQVTLPRDIRDRAEAAAKADGRTLSGWVERVVERELNPPADETVEQLIREKSRWVAWVMEEELPHGGGRALDGIELHCKRAMRELVAKVTRGR